MSLLPSMPRLRRILAPLLLVAAIPLALSAQPIVGAGGVQEGFEGKFRPAPAAPAGSSSRVEGQIPVGWTEDSAYPGADVAVRYTRITDAADGSAALRIEASRITLGSAGLLLERVYLRSDTFYRLRGTVRSVNGTSLEIAVRSGADRKNYGAQTFTAGPEWRTIDFFIPPLAKDDENAQIRLSANTPMQVDLDALSLVPVREDQLGESFRGEGNLLNLTSFPLGLSKPWIGGTTHHADPEVTGPSGLPALKMVPRPLIHDERGRPYHDANIAAPVATKPNAVHTLSAYLKGSRAGQQVTLQLGPPLKVPGPTYNKRVTLSTEWARYEFSVKLPYNARNFSYLAIRSANDGSPFWVDQVQVEVGDKATPFRRSAAAEVALSLPANYGLHFEGEALRVSATVYGDLPSGAVLTGVFHDATGKAFPVKAQKLRGGVAPQTLDFSLPRGSELPLGHYRFVAEVKKGDRSLSKPSEAILGRVRPPRKGDVFAPESPFGIHFTPTAAHARLARDLGFKWVRNEVGWSQIERADGDWHWEDFDKEIGLYHEHKFSILGILTGGLAKYGVAPEQNKGWGFWRAMVRPEHLPDFQESARRIAERYRKEITHWETQNETDLPNFSFGNIVNGVRVARTGEQMVAWQKAAYEGLHAGNPDAVVWWDLAWARPPESKQFVAAAAAQGIWDYVEGFSYHQYNGNFLGFPGDALQKRIEDVRSVMPEDKKDLPVWNTEGGFWPNHLRDLTPLTPPVVSDQTNDYFADWVVRYHVSTFANGIPRFFFFNIRNGEYYPEHEILNADASLSSQAISFSNLAWHLEGKPFAERVALRHGVNAYVFANATDSVAILLSTGSDRLPLDTLPKGLVARDVLGNEARLPLRVGDSPLYLVGDGLPAAALVERLAALRAE